MLDDEHKVTNYLYELFNKAQPRVAFLKYVHKGKTTARKTFSDALKIFLEENVPFILPEPDLILIFEDYRKLVDQYLIIAIEIKYFKNSRNILKKLRQAFREFGQPIRHYLFGFDSVVLLHVFSPEIKEENIILNYSDLIKDVIMKLKLPIAYFSIKIINGEIFEIYSPFKLDSPQNAEYILQWIRNKCMDTRNPLLPDDESTLKRRRALKAALGIP